jgi:hypothetical protein
MDAPRTPAADPPPEPTGFRGLVVQGGRGAGGYLPLRSPVTLMGRAAGCDVRVDAQTVHSLHVLLAPGDDSVTLRSLHADGVKVNGRLAVTALLRDGDTLDVGPSQYRLRWPDPAAGTDPYLESLRIQAAAVVAQQAALAEHEVRLGDREAALARQEEQLSGRLEDQRRQLLELQDQITEARAKLREKRAAHAVLAERQQRELSAARGEAAELQRTARAERHRLKDLRRRLLLRGRRHGQEWRKEAEAREAALKREADRLAAERAAFVEQVERFNGQAELDKRQLKAAWDRLHRERRAWQDRRAADDKTAAEQTCAVARRAKAAAAAEKRVVADRARLDRELLDRRRELEQLETRIVNGRQRLLEQQAAEISPAVVPTPPFMSNAATGPAEAEAALDKRRQVLARVADDLADQRLHLTEQIERLLRTQQQWHVERATALNEVERIAESLQARELDLDRRGRELHAARAAVRAEAEALTQLRLGLDAERARAESRAADRLCEVRSRWAELDARERALLTREGGWHRLLRTWGRRRRSEVMRLRTEQEACRQERAEWVSARTVWLRLVARLREERRTLTVRAAAVERLRAETLQGTGGRAAEKRLERLERQWATRCEIAARELERMQATLTAEAVRVDEASRRVRRDLLTAEARAAVLDNRAAEVEREEHAVVAERTQMAGDLDVARERRLEAERRAAELRDEVERLARLLIDAVPEVGDVSPSQAA